ncbi:MAG: NADH-quinone oxidoreductase subunit NuoE [Deltaproteobacteria bacterium]|nr:NADH-quinone oxidoreductase subunit NuoE [Deltaproteobacteria bacterium]
MSKKLLSEKFYSELKKIRPRYPINQAALLPALHLAQAEHGWLSDEVMDEVAAAIDIPPPVVREVVTFYTMYNLKPVGKYHVQVCTNISCALLGAEELMGHCEKRLGIEGGETTRDNKFTITEVECLGSCGTAPCVQINDDYHENMTPERMDKLFTELS